MNQYSKMNDLENYRKNQEELADIIGSISQAISGLHMSKERELEELSQKVKNDTFKIMVTGTFKNGKSTFINALLGEEILPAYALPCTAVINEVKYGAEKRAVLHFREKLPDPLPEKLADRAVRHMNQYKGRAIPPLEIPYDEIEEYVVIPMGEDEKQMKRQSPYEKVELFYPLEILQNGVEIIDSPGLNEDETRTRVTMEYLNKVDAILYVLNANAICAGDEMRFVQNDLRGNQFESVFFVVNRIDQVRTTEQPQIYRYAEIKLNEIYPQPELFCISALNALEGRLDDDDDRVEKSGILPLEKRLTQFLTKEKGKAKLASPAKQVRQILSREALEVVIPRERSLLETSLDDVKARYANIQPRLMLLTREKEQKESEIIIKIERCSRKVERMAKGQVNEIINAVPVWLEEFTPPTSLGAVPTKKKVEQVVTEISDYLKSRISDAQSDWQTKVLVPALEEDAQAIFNAAEQDISKIYQEIDQINLELAGEDYNNVNSVPFWQRAAGVAGGLLLGDVALAFSGGVNGIGKEFVKTLAFELGAGFILSFLGLLNPVTLFGCVAVAIIGNAFGREGKAMKKLKEKISEEAVKNLSENAEQQAQEIADGIEKNFSKVAKMIVDSISKELSDIDDQVRAIIAEKEKGEKEVESRSQELARCEQELYALNGRLDTLIFTLVE